MKYDPKIHNRKSIRLKGYDYSLPGLYFITLCCQNKKCLFGEIIGGQTILNNAGEMIKNLWIETLMDYSNTRLQKFVIMPNHFHGIIEIVGAESISAHACNKPNVARMIGQDRADIESAPTGTVSIPTIIQSFKRHTTIKYIEMVKQKILPPFNKRIWQRNYWDHIIRNEKSYNAIVDYIENNPANWLQDKLHIEQS